jgi:hypothetical protein
LPKLDEEGHLLDGDREWEHSLLNDKRQRARIETAISQVKKDLREAGMS